MGVGLFDNGDDVLNERPSGSQASRLYARGALARTNAGAGVGAGGGREADLNEDERTEAGAEVAWREDKIVLEKLVRDMHIPEITHLRPAYIFSFRERNTSFSK